MTKKILAFDIEGDDLLVSCKKIWCVCIEDVNTGESWEYGPDAIGQAYIQLQQAHRIVAHNGLGYDVPTMERLGRPSDATGNLPPCIDTLVISRLLFPDIYNHPIGGNSLGEYGKFLGIPKSEYSDFSAFSADMLAYCRQDVRLLVAIYKYLLPRCQPYLRAIRLEHDVAKIITRQQLNGFPVDTDKVATLKAAVHEGRVELERRLQEAFPPRITPMKTPQYYLGGFTDFKFDTVKDALAAGFKRSQIRPGPLKVKVEPFLPGSPQQVVERLVEKYQWVPEKYNEDDEGNRTSVSVKSDVLDSLPWPEAQWISEWRTLKARDTEADKWIEMAAKFGGKIHGSVNTNGAPSGRMAHSDPNINFPKVKHDKKSKLPVLGLDGGYGYECRSCFGPRKGWKQVGIDASGLELRMFANRLWPFDNGAYAAIVLDGDVHTANQQAAGLPTRDDAKTFIYAFLYGAGFQKIGSICLPQASVSEQVAKGKQLKDQFMSNIPAFGKFKDLVEDTLRKHKKLFGLDGRPLPIRSNHAAINTQLQSDGAVVMKQALVRLDEFLRVDLKLVPGIDYEFLANVHDEWQIECRPELAQPIGEAGKRAIQVAGKDLSVLIALDGEYKIGNNWAECH